MKESDTLGTDGTHSPGNRLGAALMRFSHELDAQQRVLADGSTAAPGARARPARIRGGTPPRFALRAARAVARIAPPGTRRYRSLRRAVRAGALLATGGASGLLQAIRERGDANAATIAARVQAEYDEWRRRHEPRAAELDRLCRENRLWPVRPLVSILMPTYNSQEGWIRPAIDSVIGQVYENWELCIADDASTELHVDEILREYEAADNRIKVIRRCENGGIAAATASALSIASGEFVALLDHDDVLRPHALHRVVETLAGAPDMDIVYSDEDLLLEDGRFGRPAFKPEFSPDFLLSVNYICHLLVLRRSLVDAAGGFRDGFDGAQDHDLLLRTTEKARRVGHIPDILYGWRQVPGSVALAGEEKMYAYAAGKRAVEEALARRGLPGRVSLGKQNGTYHVRLDLPESPRVAIVIPTRDRVDLLRECIDSIERRSTYSNYEITVIDNDSVRPETLEYLRRTPHRVARMAAPFNYSALINFGRSVIDAPYMLTVNNDTTVISPDWIEAMVEQAQRPEVGVVGGRLLYPDGRPQSEGIAVGNVRGGYMAANLDGGWMGRVIRNVTAVTGACQMVRTSVFDEVGGYDEEMAISYNDVDFCLRVREAGYLVIYTPHAQLRHHESATRKGVDPRSDHEVFWARWGVEGGIPDPYMSPHLRDLNPLVLKLDPLPLDH